MIGNWINGAIATCGFEMKRSFTVQRNAVSFVLALFPPVMTGMLTWGPRTVGAQGIPFVEVVILVLVGLVTMLSLLLWATPNVYSELEGKSWTFISSRPGGRVGNFLGKYLAAIISSFAIATIAVSLSLGVASTAVPLEDPLWTWLASMVIFLFATLAYGAVLSMIGTITYKRAMVVGVGYLLAWEGLIAMVPALVNQFTIRFHLQSLVIEWLPFVVRSEDYALIYGDMDVKLHILIVIAMTIAFLVGGAYVIVNRQYVTKDET